MPPLQLRRWPQDLNENFRVIGCFFHGFYMPFVFNIFLTGGELDFWTAIMKLGDLLTWWTSLSFFLVVFIRCGLWEVMFFTRSCCFLIDSLEEIEKNHRLIYLAYFHFNKPNNLWHIESYDLYILIHIVFSSSLNLFSNATTYPTYSDVYLATHPALSGSMRHWPWILEIRCSCCWGMFFGVSKTPWQVPMGV